MQTMNKKMCGLVLAFLMSGASQATSISYDLGTNTPTFFGDVVVDFGGGPVHYDVSLTWNQTFFESYGSTASPDLVAWGDSAKALTAMNALIDALEADSYAGATGGFQMVVPYALPNVLSVVTVGLNSLPLTPVYGAASLSSTLGYTHWTEIAPVPVPAALWLFGAGVAALSFVRRSNQ